MTDALSSWNSVRRRSDASRVVRLWLDRGAAGGARVWEGSAHRLGGRRDRRDLSGPCYLAAIDDLPEDVRAYTSAKDDISRELQASAGGR